MPEDSSVEDIMYEIDFIAHVLEGLKDSEEGRTITTEHCENNIWDASSELLKLYLQHT